MFTIIVLFCGLLVFACIVGILTGIVAISPILLLFILLPLLDICMFKIFFGRKKK